MSTPRTDWHLDRKVTLSLILALLLNAAGSIWWAATLSAAVSQNTTRILGNSTAISALVSQGNSVNENLARIQEGQRYQSEMIKEMRDQLRGN